MVKRTSTRAAAQQRSRQVKPGVNIQLMMECVEEDLSPAQKRHYTELTTQYRDAMKKIADAKSMAASGKAIITMHNDPRKPIPPPPTALYASGSSTPQWQQNTSVGTAGQQGSQKQSGPERSSSPDVIFVSQSPPKAQNKTPQKPAVQKPQPAPQMPTLQARPTQPPKMTHVIPNIPANQLLYQQINPSNLLNLNNFLPGLQGTNVTQLGPPKLVQMVPVQNSSGGVKRQVEDQNSAIYIKRKKLEIDNSGNWVPLDEYYYGKMEGDPTYSEVKDEYRFKCWFCSKMLYNNIKAMMHIQGHIDSSKQQNIDLSDLCQCKHCYKQFDTPFEMQTHVEKVHTNNANVLLCRICERDHDTRQALTNHMRLYHTSCEMPYMCQLCKFRSSMYSDVVDHFKKKHDSSQYILCLYCLKTFSVKFVSQGWGQTQTYYGHLLKHQSKASSKKCPLCRLTFINPVEMKNHKKKDHLPNQKGIGSNTRYTTPGQLMIKVPDSGLQPKLKSLNAPAVTKILDFAGTQLPMSANQLHCFECKMSMGTTDHYKKHIECSMCRYATSCSFAYANHMMGFHSGQMSSLNLNIPWERPMPITMYCLCGFGSRYGNKIANHLVYCTKRSCYTSKPDCKLDESMSDDDRDPRHKPGASLLDVLGLVKKRTVTPRLHSRSKSSEEKELVWKSTETVEPEPVLEETKPDDTPAELKGHRKWSTVRITDPLLPSKTSVFLGEEKTKTSEGTEVKTDEKGDRTDVASVNTVVADEMRETSEISTKESTDNVALGDKDYSADLILGDVVSLKGDALNSSEGKTAEYVEKQPEEEVSVSEEKETKQTEDSRVTESNTQKEIKTKETNETQETSENSASSKTGEHLEKIDVVLSQNSTDSKVTSSEVIKNKDSVEEACREIEDLGEARQSEESEPKEDLGQHEDSDSHKESGQKACHKLQGDTGQTEDSVVTEDSIPRKDSELNRSEEKVEDVSQEGKKSEGFQSEESLAAEKDEDFYKEDEDKECDDAVNDDDEPKDKNPSVSQQQQSENESRVTEDVEMRTEDVEIRTETKSCEDSEVVTQMEDKMEMVQKSEAENLSEERQENVHFPDDGESLPQTDDVNTDDVKESVSDSDSKLISKETKYISKVTDPHSKSSGPAEAKPSKDTGLLRSEIKDVPLNDTGHSESDPHCDINKSKERSKSPSRNSHRRDSSSNRSSEDRDRRDSDSSHRDRGHHDNKHGGHKHRYDHRDDRPYNRDHHNRYDERNNYHHHHGYDNRGYHDNRGYQDNRGYHGNYHQGNRGNYRGSNRGHWGGRGGYGGYGRGQQWGYR